MKVFGPFHPPVANGVLLHLDGISIALVLLRSRQSHIHYAASVFSFSSVPYALPSLIYHTVTPQSSQYHHVHLLFLVNRRLLHHRRHVLTPSTMSRLTLLTTSPCYIGCKSSFITWWYNPITITSCHLLLHLRGLTCYPHPTGPPLRLIIS